MDHEDPVCEVLFELPRMEYLISGLINFHSRVVFSLIRDIKNQAFKNTENSRTTPTLSERPFDRMNHTNGAVIKQILSFKTVPGISLFHNWGGGNFSGGIADQFDPPRSARVNLISEKSFYLHMFDCTFPYKLDR